MFCADTRRQLRRAIQSLVIQVPPRGQGRTTDHCEQWQIQRLLETLFRAGELDAPVTLMKRESPDFLLKTQKLAVGIEATQAINDDYVRALMHPNAQRQGSVVDPSLYKWGTAGRSRQQIADEAGRTELTGYGWVGDSVEHEFAVMVAEIVSEKSEKLRDGYERFDCDSLLIYQDQTLPFLNMEGARSFAEPKVAPFLGPSGFRKVYVDDGLVILELTATSSRVLPEAPRAGTFATACAKLRRTLRNLATSTVARLLR